ILVQSAPVHFAQRRRNDHGREFLSDDVILSITECLFRRWIEFDDSAVEIHGDDAIEGGLKNRALAHFALAKFLFSDKTCALTTSERPEHVSGGKQREQREPFHGK